MFFKDSLKFTSISVFWISCNLLYWVL